MDVIWTPEKEKKFLEALAELCNVTEACASSSVSRSLVYLKRSEDPEFAMRWDKALEIGIEALEDEASRRAKSGVNEPVFYQGVQCGTVRKYSDTLLIFLLKGAKPEKYRENSKVEMSGSMSITSLTDEELAAKYQAAKEAALASA